MAVNRPVVIPRTRVRRHVAELRAAGWTITEIADAAGVHWQTVAQHAHRRAGAVSRVTERLILAVEP